MPARRRLFAAGCVVVSALGLAACSSSSEPPPQHSLPTQATASVVNGVQQLTVIADSNFRFYPSTLIVHQGRVRIILKNPKPTNGSGAPPHDLDVNGVAGAYAPLIPVGHQEVIQFTAPSPGTYPFECTIHVPEGMVGKLIVKPGT